MHGPPARDLHFGPSPLTPAPPFTYTFHKAESKFHKAETVRCRGSREDRSKPSPEGPTMTYTVNCSILLTELPPLERPAAAKAAGFDAVEFWWPFENSVPSDAETTEFENAIKNAGVQLTGLNFNAGNMPGGDRGLVSWPARSTEFQDNIDVVAGIGERLGCKAFNALYGNRVDGEPAE